MLNVQLQKFNALNFRSNERQESKTYVTNNRFLPMADSVSFKGRQLESLSELIAKKAELTNYYRKVQGIADFVIAEAERHGITLLNDPKEFPISSTFDRIPFDGSIGLRMSDNYPSSLLTPLGQMRILGSTAHHGDSMERFMASLTQKLGLEEVVKETKVGSDLHGPIYAVTKTPTGEAIPKLKADGLRANSAGNRSMEDLNSLVAEILPNRAYQA